MAALRASQQMLQKKHALEEQEEQLRRRKERLELEMKLAESMARVKVYQDVDSESHASVNRIVSKPLHSDVEPCVLSTSVQAATQSLSTSCVSNGDDTKMILNRSQSQSIH